MDLKFAAADARAIAAVFRQRGEALYRKTIVTELVDARATKAAIRGRLREIVRAASPQDTLVVFLAGHGTMVGQRFYFIPHDFRTDPGGTRRPRASAAGPPGRRPRRRPQHRPSVATLDGPRRLPVGGRAGDRAVARPVRDARAIERISRSQGLFTIAASVAGDEAQEMPELGHGVLSYCAPGRPRHRRPGAAQGGLDAPGQFRASGRRDRVVQLRRGPVAAPHETVPRPRARRRDEDRGRQLPGPPGRAAMRPDGAV